MSETRYEPKLLAKRKEMIAEIREWHEGKRDSFPPFTVFEAVGVMLDELERLEREYAEERAAHNAYVTELSQLEEEMRKLREERDAYYNNARYTEAAFHEVTSLRSQLQSAQQEIEQYKQFEQQYNEFKKSWEKYQQDKEKMIEGLRKLYRIMKTDHDEAHEAEAYDVCDLLEEPLEIVQNILHEIWGGGDAI